MIPNQLTKFQGPRANNFQDILLKFKMPKYTKGRNSADQVSSR